MKHRFNIFLSVTLSFIFIAIFYNSSTAQIKDLCINISSVKTQVATLNTSFDVNNNIKVVLTVAKTLNDNTYGTNSIGWPGGNHKFDHLVGSDKAHFVFKNASGTTVFDFDLDYLHGDNSIPSKYRSLGISGGDGKLYTGQANWLLSYNTSLNRNFNEFGYVLTTNSPATNSNYDPNPSYPNWIFEMIYEVTIDKAAFGTSGYGSVTVPDMHHSPNKYGIDKVVQPYDCTPPKGSIGDKVWLDANENGIQDADESGVANVTVKLYSGSSLLKTTVTNSTGMYLFSDLVAGSYQVEFVLPSGYLFSQQDQGTDDSKDSDADITTGKTIIISLAAGQNDLKWDAGIYRDCKNSLGDFVWHDKNVNGIQDAGEVGIEGVVVELLKGTSVIQTSTTDAAGKYLFTNLANGTYSVRVAASNYASGGILYSSAQTKWYATKKNQGSDDSKDSDAGKNESVSVTLNCANNITIDFGFFKTCVSVTKSSNKTTAKPGDVITYTFTAENCGDISLTGGVDFYDALINPVAPHKINNISPINPGDKKSFTKTYTVKESDCGDLVNTVKAVGHPADGSADVEHTASVTVKIECKSSIGDKVWNDLNENGLQDDGEPGIKDITVKLFDCADNFKKEVKTDADGKYLFSELTPGDYYLQFVKPSDFLFTTKDAGSDDSKDSDADVSTGKTVCTTLSPSENDLTWDAGLIIKKASLGDKVWKDLNKDGIQDEGEPGIKDITVKLYNCADVYIKEVKTNANGIYLFNNLIPGSYKVLVQLPDDYLFSLKYQGSDDSKDSDIDPITWKSECITLAAGENNLTIDAGMYLKPASIGDFIWKDLDKDGIQDEGELGMKDVVVKLYDCAEGFIAQTTTNENGLYSFANLEPGSYVILVQLPDGHSFSPKDQGSDDAKDSDVNPTSWKTICITLSPGENNTTVDAGIYLTPVPVCTIGDKVWNDVNMNGIQDSGEEGMKDVLVRLMDCSGNKLAEKKTNESGLYLFENVIKGSYQIQFVLPSSYAFSPKDRGGNDLLDSDADVLTGKTVCFPIDPPHCDSNSTRWDAGIYRLKASVGDFVWYDLNKNGIQDSGEPGISGITVKLFDCSNNLMSTTTTNSTGKYKFEDVMPGNYYVQFFAPTGYLFTQKNQGTDKKKDSDADPITGKTTCFELKAGQNDMTWDAGLSECITGAKVCGLVFNDVNANGIKDAGEVGIANVVIKLWGTSANLIATTLTDVQGKYEFLNVVDGQYHVQEIDPDGYYSTTPNSKLITISGFDQCGIEFGDRVKPTPEPCDLTKYKTYSNASWCLEPAKSLLISKFSSVFSSGMTLGGISSGYKATFSSASAVIAFLPQVGIAGSFNTNYSNPTTTSAGVFGGNLAALELNVQFNDAGFLGFTSTTKLKNLVVASGPMKDYKVSEVLAMAHKAIGGSSTPFSIAILNNVVESINANFNCDCSRGYLTCPKDPDMPGGGFDAGVESNANLADLLLRRLTKIEYGQTTKILRNPKIAFTASYGLYELFPNVGPMGSTPSESTPFDILGISNATSAYAVDYNLKLAKGDTRIASMFATTTNPPYIYEHTKAICDRLIDAEMQTLTQLEIGGKYYFASVLHKQNEGVTDYTIHFSVYERGGTFIVDSRWLIEDYTIPAGVTNIYNFQVWANNFNNAMYLVLGIVDQFQSKGNVEYLNNNSLPTSLVYVQKGKYQHNGTVELVINNSQLVADNVTILVRSRATQSGGREENSNTYSLVPGLNTITFKTGIVSDANVYLYSNNGFRDEVFVSGGAYTYLNGTSSNVATFTTNAYAPQRMSDYPEGSLVLSGGAKVEGQLNDWVTLFRSLTANASAYDLSDYNAIRLTVKGQGNIWLRIEQDGVKDYNFHSRSITLSGSEETLTIPFDLFLQREGVSSTLNPQLVRKISVVMEKRDNKDITNFEFEIKNIAFLSKGGSDKGKGETLPQEFKLAQNYPNPFNPSTMIEYSVANNEFVTLKVYDVLGQEIATLVNELKAPGKYSARFDASSLTSGIYVYRIQSESFSSTRKMILQK